MDITWNQLMELADFGSVKRELADEDMVRVKFTMAGREWRGLYNSEFKHLYGVEMGYASIDEDFAALQAIKHNMHAYLETDETDDESESESETATSLCRLS